MFEIATNIVLCFNFLELISFFQLACDVKQISFCKTYNPRTKDNYTMYKCLARAWQGHAKNQTMKSDVVVEQKLNNKIKN